jgi:hypothetical protein
VIWFVSLDGGGKISLMNDFKLRIEVDLSKVESVDTGREVVYGGTYTVDGVTRPARGNDLTSGNYLDEVMEAIQEKCEQKFGTRPEDEDLLEHLVGFESGTFLILGRDGVLHVSSVG